MGVKDNVINDSDPNAMVELKINKKRFRSHRSRVKIVIMVNKFYFANLKN